MVPENIAWAFFSPAHYQQMKDESVVSGKPSPKDIYYKDFSGKWVKVTAVFECIEKARNDYRYNDVKYLGGVLVNTKGEVDRGAGWPPVPFDSNNPTPVPHLPLKKKKKLNRYGTSGTVSVKKQIYYDPFGYPPGVRGNNNY
jgi:hypothetical protein